MDLEKMKKELGIKKAEAAMLDLQVRKQERLEDIERIENHIKLQEEIIDNLTKELKEMEG